MASFVPAFSSPAASHQGYYVVLTDNYQLLTAGEQPWQPMPADTWRFSGIVPEVRHHIGLYRDRACYVVKVRAESTLPPGYRWVFLRQLLVEGSIADTEFDTVGAGLQLLNWDQSHQFCGRCGAATSADSRERARVCDRCEIRYYPRISPCVMALITRGEECLLAHHKHSPAGFYSALAGFIEPGETVENALHREVAEEVSLSVTNLRYFASQPWPFPGQLMIGYYADYHSGEIVVDEEEIAEARWFHYRDLPRVPPIGSLSGKLIQAFVQQFE